MNKIIKGLLAIVSISLLACNKYLDVQPNDRLIDIQIFTSKSSIEKALNGIYINLVSDNLYGGCLTVSTVDVLAQYYNTPERNRFASSGSYQFLDGSFLQSDISAIWGNAYTNILNINEFIKGTGEATENIISPDEKALLLGEAYGLRAFVLFDMLRLFGPVYAVDSSSETAPYPTQPATRLSPLIPARQFMDSLVNDLGMATSLLAKDPIIQYGIQPFDNTDVSGNFFRARNRRMNYYAVKSLLARVYLYRGDKANALKNALDVITISGSIFPWTPESDSRPGIKNPNRIFSSEIIFGPENTRRDVMHQKYFAASNLRTSAAVAQATLLAPLSANLAAIFENQDNDYRLRSSWTIDQKANYNFKTFIKFAPVTTTSPSSSGKTIQPLIRLSELYYIAAECSGDRSYLNTVRANRGLIIPIDAGANISDEITKEYRKEFFGEGQLFFYYKRKNFATILSGSSSSSSIPMDKGKYVLPLPLSETQYR
jgi:starch-binding outer membrane protein, SusD/RagB family